MLPMTTYHVICDVKNRMLSIHQVLDSAIATFDGPAPDAPDANDPRAVTVPPTPLTTTPHLRIENCSCTGTNAAVVHITSKLPAMQQLKPVFALKLLHDNPANTSNIQVKRVLM